MKRSIIGLWINIARAYEIAKLGGYPLMVVCPIDDYETAQDDYALLKEFYDVPFSGESGLIVEMYKPNAQDKRTYETLADINRRVDKAKKRPLPTNFASTSCDALLKTAAERLNLSVKQCESVEKVAAVIAQLDGKSEIDASHVAEAIHYHCLQTESCVIAEKGNVIMFGKHIQVTKNTIEHEEALAAIEYLKQYVYATGG